MMGSLTVAALSARVIITAFAASAVVAVLAACIMAAVLAARVMVAALAGGCSARTSYRDRASDYETGPSRI